MVSTRPPTSQCPPARIPPAGKPYSTAYPGGSPCYAPGSRWHGSRTVPRESITGGQDVEVDDRVGSRVGTIFRWCRARAEHVLLPGHILFGGSDRLPSGRGVPVRRRRLEV